MKSDATFILFLLLLNSISQFRTGKCWSRISAEEMHVWRTVYWEYSSTAP